MTMLEKAVNGLWNCDGRDSTLSGGINPRSAENPGGFFSESGAPVPMASDEKPGGLFSTTLSEKT